MIRLFALAFFVASGAVAMWTTPSAADSALDTYVASAVAAEQCGEIALTGVEEIRLAQLIKQETAGTVLSSNVWTQLVRARSAQPAHCAALTTVEQVRLFVKDVLPRLRSPYMPPAANNEK